MFFLGKCLKHHFLSKYGCELGVTAEISPKTQFMHTTGVVIGDGCLVEEGVKIYSSVVLGRKNIQSEDDYPKILKNAILHFSKQNIEFSFTFSNAICIITIQR